MERVCIVGAGVIGSLFAGHLARVCEVSVLTRRREHADALNEQGLRVSGKSDHHARVTATNDPAELPELDVAIVATKASGLESAVQALEGRFPDATIVTVLNGIGAEEVVRAHGGWPIVSGVTFMSGTRHSDTHVEYILDTETWLGPYEDTSFAVVQDIAETIVAVGAEGRGAPRSPPGAVVEADLQRSGQPDCRADRPSARLPLRRRRQSRAISGTSSTGSSTRERLSLQRPGSSCTTTRGR